MRWLACLLLSLAVASSAYSQAGKNDPIQIYVEDGQFISHVITVFVSAKIERTQNPKLVLHRPRTPFSDPVPPFDGATLVDMGTNQAMATDVTGSQAVFKTGTVLLFRLHDYKPALYKPVFRVRPVLRWDPADASDPGAAISGDSVYFANASVVYSLAIAIVVIPVVVLGWITHRARGSAFALLCGRDGRLSLSRTQVACWTAAIGTAVFAFGIKELDAPTIPESLVILMGLSLGTSGISYVQFLRRGQTKSKEGGEGEPTPPGAAAPQPPPSQQPVKPPHPRLADLITVPDPASGDTLSIARAHMVFWTVLLLGVFLGKSFIDGALWQVPWEMVALMGISQAGYLGPQFAKT